MSNFKCCLSVGTDHDGEDDDDDEVTICWRGTRERKRVQPSGATAADLKWDVELARTGGQLDIINIFFELAQTSGQHQHFLQRQRQK